MIFYLALDENNKTWIKGTQADAREINKNFTQIDVPDDKAGRMAWIQQMLDETINAAPAVNVDTSDIPEATEEFFEKAELKLPEPAAENVTAKAARFEDEWESFPISLKFHYAAKAMEDGRDILGRIAAQ